MDALRGELEGTLARTAQKKQTALNRYEKFKRDQEKVKKYGFATRPAATSEVSSLKAAEHFYREVRAEFSNKLARMNNHITIADNGMAEVRVVNDDLNALVREMKRWSDRVVALGGAAQQQATEEGQRPTYRYFGAAKELPEALGAARAAGQKQPREDDEYYSSDYDSDDSDAADEAAGPSASTSASKLTLKGSEAQLMPPVQLVLSDAMEEATLRRVEAAARTNDAVMGNMRMSVKGYKLTLASVLPTEESVWDSVVARRRAALMARLKK